MICLGKFLILQLLIANYIYSENFVIMIDIDMLKEYNINAEIL